MSSILHYIHNRSTKIEIISVCKFNMNHIPVVHKLYTCMKIIMYKVQTPKMLFEKHSKDIINKIKSYYSCSLHH